MLPMVKHPKYMPKNDTGFYRFVKQGIMGVCV